MASSRTLVYLQKLCFECLLLYIQAKNIINVGQSVLTFATKVRDDGIVVPEIDNHFDATLGSVGS